MHIYRPLLGHDEQTIEHYQIKKSIQKIELTDRVDRLLFEYQDDPERIFLLEEELFELVRCPIKGVLYEPLKLDQLTNLIEGKIQEVKKNYRIQGKILLYDIDHIRVNGEESSYILGQSGKLSRDIFLVFLKPSLALSLPQLGKKKTNAHIYPASYFTVQYISKQLDIPSFMMLSIQEHNIKLIVVKDGFYDNSYTLDWGINHLKQILISNNIISYLYAKIERIESHSFVQSLLIENLDFYCGVIVDWIKEQVPDVTTCLLSHPELNHNLLYESFIRCYQNRINGYIIPNSLHAQLKNYDRERKSQELDILTYLNFSQYKTLV